MPSIILHTLGYILLRLWFIPLILILCYMTHLSSCTRAHLVAILIFHTTPITSLLGWSFTYAVGSQPCKPYKPPKLRAPVTD